LLPFTKIKLFKNQPSAEKSPYYFLQGNGNYGSTGDANDGLIITGAINQSQHSVDISLLNSEC
jgi:hypothetical protein